MLTLAFRFYFADAPTTRQNAPKIVFTVQTIFILPDPEKRRRNDSVRSFSRQVQSLFRVFDTDGLFLAFYVKVYAYFVIERMERMKFVECVSNPLTYANKNYIIENRNSTTLFLECKQAARPPSNEPHCLPHTEHCLPLYYTADSARSKGRKDRP